MQSVKIWPEKTNGEQNGNFSRGSGIFSGRYVLARLMERWIIAKF
jgi:hypothetical protein